MFARTPQRLGIGFKKITQRRRSRGRIIQFKQSHYEPKPKNYEPIPMSVLGTGPLRRLVHSPKEEAEELMKKVDWNAYKTGVPGVRWHPTGGFRVQFKAHYKPKNFKVNCDMYFRVALYGFAEAKRRAIAYHTRLCAEWAEQLRIWKILDKKAEIRKLEKKRLFYKSQGATDSSKFVQQLDVSEDVPLFDSGVPMLAGSKGGLELNEKDLIDSSSITPSKQEDEDSFKWADKYGKFMSELDDEAMSKKEREWKRKEWSIKQTAGEEGFEGPIPDYLLEGEVGEKARERLKKEEKRRISGGEDDVEGGGGEIAERTIEFSRRPR